MVLERGGKRLEISESLLSTDFCLRRNYLKPFPFAIINLNYIYHNDIRSIETCTDFELCYFIIGLFPIYRKMIPFSNYSHFQIRNTAFFMKMLKSPLSLISFKIPECS